MIGKGKRGSILDPIILVVVAFLTIIFFATWMYSHSLITTELTSIGTVGNLNITDAAQDTFGTADVAMGQLRIIAVLIIFGSIVSIFISNFIIKAHPIFFIVYVLIAVFAVIFAAIISNSYETLMSNDTIGSTISSFTAGSFIMLNLPVWVTVITFIGAIFLFSGIHRDVGLGGGI